MENWLEEDASRKSRKEVNVIVQVWNPDERKLGSGSESLLGDAQLGRQFRSYPQIVEFGKNVQGEWEGLVEKRDRRASTGTLTSMGMKQHNKPRKDISHS